MTTSEASTTQATSHYPVIIIQYAKIQPPESQTTTSYTLFYLDLYLFIYCLLCERTSIVCLLPEKRYCYKINLFSFPIHLRWHSYANTVMIKQFPPSGLSSCSLATSKWKKRRAEEFTNLVNSFLKSNNGSWDKYAEGITLTQYTTG